MGTNYNYSVILYLLNIILFSLMNSSLMRFDNEDEENLSPRYDDTESPQTSKLALLANLSPPTTSYHRYSTICTSYFDSTIETAIKQRLNEEPIPFIDDNLSTTHSRRSSACWSDKTSLGSRFSLSLKMNRIRSRSQNRSTLSSEKGKRRYHQRTTRHAVPTRQPNRFHNDL